jgi:nitroimidazol reductase NimA-like FMN-containing flavoprotein (pyridoxamine 5'-phosphate oxidase superfamily)
MKLPVTQLDARFSDAGAAATEWTETRRVLEAAELFWICTVRSDGRPHLTPLVAVWLDDALYFCTGETEQKFLNLRGNSSVLLVTGCNTWDHGLDVSVEGTAVPVTDDDLLRRLAQAWAAKWDGQWQWDVRDGSFHHKGGGAAPVFRVAPSKVLAFAKGSFSHTRYVF